MSFVYRRSLAALDLFSGIAICTEIWVGTSPISRFRSDFPSNFLAFILFFVCFQLSASTAALRMKLNIHGVCCVCVLYAAGGYCCKWGNDAPPPSHSHTRVAMWVTKPTYLDINITAWIECTVDTMQCDIDVWHRMQQPHQSAWRVHCDCRERLHLLLHCLLFAVDAG